MQNASPLSHYIHRLSLRSTKVEFDDPRPHLRRLGYVAHPPDTIPEIAHKLAEPYGSRSGIVHKSAETETHFVGNPSPKPPGRGDSVKVPAAGKKSSPDYAEPPSRGKTPAA